MENTELTKPLDIRASIASDMSRMCVALSSSGKRELANTRIWFTLWNRLGMILRGDTDNPNLTQPSFKPVMDLGIEPNMDKYNFMYNNMTDAKIETMMRQYNRTVEL